MSTLLFLHGVGGGRAAWDRQLPYFTARGHRALAWDQPGYGGTEPVAPYDLGRLAAVWIVGRSKDVIISGGENIYPAELENVMADCPAIAESAVVGVADAKWGEAACAVVVRRPGAALDEGAVLALFQDRLARYKHPRRIVFTDAPPKNALGKIQKHELKKLL